MAQDQPGAHDRARLRQPGTAYLLSAIGMESSRRWHERMRDLGLDPREVVVLRMVAAEPGRSQASLGSALQVRASHLVAVIDRLQERRLLERRANASDRRANALHLTRLGHATLTKVMTVSARHEADLTGTLTAAERAQLEDMLARIARGLGLAEGGHPGFDD